MCLQIETGELLCEWKYKMQLNKFFELISHHCLCINKLIIKCLDAITVRLHEKLLLRRSAMQIWILLCAKQWKLATDDLQGMEIKI